MKKVLIYKPGMRRDPSVGELPNIGMAILAAEFEANGWEARVVDHQMAPKPNVEEGLTILKEYKPDLLCISLVTFEWVLPVTHKIMNLANHLNIPVWVGGPHSTAFHDIMAKDERITKVVNGEVDGQLQEVFKSNEKVVVLPRPKSFTTPNFTLTDDYEKIGLYPLFTSRGCKYKCNFCAATVTHGNILRNRTLDDVWKELDSIEEKLPGIHTIWVIDDDFITNFDHAMEFCRGFEERGYREKYEIKVINVRADRLHDEFLDWLKRMGIKQLSVGMESADKEVFRRIGKGEKLDTVKDAILKLQSWGITPWLNMIIGLPYDSKEAHKNSLNWVASLPKPKVVQWLIYAPFRGTRAYDHYVKMGAIEDGYIPGFQSEYQQIPQEGFFDIPGFDRYEQRIAQLEAYLKCESPILIMNDAEVRKLCKKHNMMDLYKEWRANAPIEEFVKKTVPDQVKRGRLDTSKMGDVDWDTRDQNRQREVYEIDH